jgi:hypothetical protein
MLQADQQFTINWIDASGFSCLQRCPARYMLERLCGLTPITSEEFGTGNKRALAADFGTAMHAALPSLYDHGSPIAPEAPLRNAMDRFTYVWSTYNHGAGDDKRNPQRALSMLQDFHRCHAGANCPYDVMQRAEAATPPGCTRISAQEVPFLLDAGIGLPLAGRIDAPVRLRSSRLVLALDYKTTQEISARFFNNFNGSPQAIIYAWALRRLLGGESVFGFAVEALRVSASNTETQLHIVSVKPCEVTELLAQLQHAVSAIQSYNLQQRWPQNFAGCSPYASYGQPGYVCEYKPLCQLDDWHDGLAGYRTQEPFSPLGSPKGSPSSNTA